MGIIRTAEGVYRLERSCSTISVLLDNWLVCHPLDFSNNNKNVRALFAREVRKRSYAAWRSHAQIHVYSSEKGTTIKKSLVADKVNMKNLI